jgi:hypothetical protein
MRIGYIGVMILGFHDLHSSLSQTPGKQESLRQSAFQLPLAFRE